MNRNIGNKEKLIRILLGISIIVTGAYFKSWWFLTGLIFIVTALIEWCPISALLGINTCKVKEKN